MRQQRPCLKRWMLLKRKVLVRLTGFVLLLALCGLTPAYAEIRVPSTPPNYVVDMAGIVEDSVERRINGFLRELEQKTTAQVVVLTVPGMEGGAIEDFSLSVAEQWGLGQAGKDNGVLIVVALKERKYRFEIGYGLEGVLPDSKVGSIGRQYIVPYFKKGDYSNGTAAAALAVANEIAAGAGVTITGMPVLRATGRTVKRGKRTVLGTVVSIVFFIVMAILFIRNPRLFIMFMLMSSMGGRRGSWGGGGGFGGGGGGGFGGGGASGGW